MAYAAQGGAGDDDVVVVHEGVPLNRKLPAEFIEEWKSHAEFAGKYLDFMKHMLVTGTRADVTFILDGEEEGDTKRIRAHKSLLKFKSAFFTTMFSDRWAQNEINLSGTGVQADDFRSFLEYLYMEQISITNDNVLALYHLSDMYQIDDLKLKCEEFLEKNVDEENVLPLFNTVYAYDHMQKSNVLTKLIARICMQGDAMLDNPEFLKLNEAKLALIFSRKKFNSKPLKLLRFCIHWVRKNLGEQTLNDLKRVDAIVRNRLKLAWHHEIPPFGPSHQFWFGNKDPLQSQVQSGPEFMIGRFAVTQNSKVWKYRRNRADRISFRVSDAILLTGIGLYCNDYAEVCSCCNGRFHVVPRTYNFEVRVHVHGKQHQELARVRKKNVSITDDPIYKVILDSPIHIYPDNFYTIAVTVDGLPTSYGEGGHEEKLIICEGGPVIFEFKEAESTDPDAKLSNPTGVPIGQIPQIFFRLIPGDEDGAIEIL